MPELVTTTSVTVPPEIIKLTRNPVPVPPVNPTSKYCPSVNPEPPFVTTTLSINPPWVNEDSKISGEEPLLNWIIEPAGIVSVKALFSETVVVPPVVNTPFIFVFSWIPEISETTSWPIKAFWFVKNINWEEPLFAWVNNFAKYLVSAPFTDCTTGA